jgi:hypothetical protein
MNSNNSHQRTCRRCGKTYYGDPDENFYFISTRGVYHSPCKSCISNINKTDEAKKRRNAAVARYKKTPRGRLVQRLAELRRRILDNYGNTPKNIERYEKVEHELQLLTKENS